MMVNLAQGMLSLGHEVHIVVATNGGALRTQVPHGARLFELGARRTLTSVPALRRYLRKEAPAAIVSALSHANVSAVIAAISARYRGPVVVAEHHHPELARGSFVDWVIVPSLMRLTYRRAERVIAVSHGVKDGLIATTKLNPNKLDVIYNPVISDGLSAALDEPVDDPFPDAPNTPLILGVGRLIPAKNFSNLIRAFSLLRARMEARLLILGEGELRQTLLELITEMGLEDVVSLPGFVAKPYGYFARASLFVLSSDFEALPTVLIEAMAAGTPVVATDCPSGPREILADGAYGELVDPDDPVALADAMERALIAPRPQADSGWLAQFSHEYATRQYLEVLFAGGLKW